MFLTHSCPIAASYPWLTPLFASRIKTRNILTSRFSAFCFAGVAFFPQHWGALGVWPSSIVCFLFHLFQSPQWPGVVVQATYMAVINKHSAYIVLGWLMWSKKLACVNEHLTTQESSCCSLQHPEVVFILFSAICSIFFEYILWLCVCTLNAPTLWLSLISTARLVSFSFLPWFVR